MHLDRRLPMLDAVFRTLVPVHIHRPRNKLRMRRRYGPTRRQQRAQPKLSLPVKHPQIRHGVILLLNPQVRNCLTDLARKQLVFRRNG